MTDSRGTSVTFPLGTLSFVDTAVSYSPGSTIPRENATDPDAGLGSPNYQNNNDGSFLSLGCGGSAVYRFDDNTLIDVPGPDLWIFEVGPDVEATDIAVSVDGREWLDLGRIQGATASVDLNGRGTPGAQYRFVRITDGRSGCGGRWPGADIDAIGAIGAQERDPVILPDAPQIARFTTTRGQEAVFPLGLMSFADAVVRYAPVGDIPRTDATDPATALHAPDYVDNDSGGFVTLGCGGSAVYRFDDNTLIDVPGPDLWIFEVGPDVEGTSVAISADGVSWIEVGDVNGATDTLDIASFVPAGASYRYVRLTDDARHCTGDWPGADIDAIGAIGAGQRVVLDAAVLFDFDSAALRPTALRSIQTLAQTIQRQGAARVVIEGHTDAQGAEGYNQSLSLDRAAAVVAALTQLGIPGTLMQMQGFGESRPVARNDTDAGRQQNRRVEVLIFAPSSSGATVSGATDGGATK